MAEPRGTLTLLAPLSGPLLPIESVPDPVFAQKIVGDGVSIDPVSSRVLAPCDATVLQAHAAGHAVNLRTREGVEIVIHVGLDSVALKGEGFLPRVRAGDVVAAGDVLIEFAADYVATHARSLLTQVVVASAERVAEMRVRSGRVEAGRDPILELTLAGDAAGTAAGERAAGAGDTPPAPLTGERQTSAPIVVPNPSGLHARPAAVLAAAAKRFRSEVRLRRGQDEANARSLTALMQLEVGAGESVQVLAAGPDAADAVAALAAMIASGLGEEGATAGAAKAEAAAGSAATTSGATPAAGTPPPRPAADARLLLGIPASPGVAVGQVFQLRREDVAVREAGGGPEAERRQLERAFEEARLQLEALRTRLTREADPGRAAIFAAHEELLDDPDLLRACRELIDTGKSAAYAWRAAFGEQAQRLERLKSALLRGRAADLRDVGRRVLRLLSDAPDAEEPVRYPAGCVIVAEDLSPSQTAGLDRERVLGFCTVGGGATSHVAILARALELPAVAGIEARALEVADGTRVVLDGDAGTLRLAPSDAELARAGERVARRADERRREAASAHLPARTTDGHLVEVGANVGGLADTERAVALGADGVGLLRSEFLFLGRATPPSEDEQHAAYSAMARALGRERPLVVRTLDVGGDKPLPYLPLPREENPFLGVRGLRILLEHPAIFRTQVRAVLRAASEGRLLLMLPMVATLAELREAKAVVEEERLRLGAAPLPIGIMIEVPAAALMADAFAREADFFSVGTNDLTQYTLAMDRGHPKLAGAVDGLNPAVLRLVAEAARAAHAHGRSIGVCGGLAGDPQAVPLLIGLGVDELSVAPASVPAIKARVRELGLERCRALAERALAAESAAAVRALSPAQGDEA